ncbi:unnamed protein product [Caretta caretta]
MLAPPSWSYANLASLGCGGHLGIATLELCQDGVSGMWRPSWYRHTGAAKMASLGCGGHLGIATLELAKMASLGCGGHLGIATLELSQDGVSGMWRPSWYRHTGAVKMASLGCGGHLGITILGFRQVSFSGMRRPLQGSCQLGISSVGMWVAMLVSPYWS